MAGIGAVLRVEAGTFQVAVAANIGYNDSQTAELWAIKEALELLQLQNIKEVHIQTDSMIVLNIFHRKHAAHPHHQVILHDSITYSGGLKIYIMLIWISFVYREANYQVADSLASFAGRNDLIHSLFCILLLS